MPVWNRLSSGEALEEGGGPYMCSDFQRWLV